MNSKERYSDIMNKAEELAASMKSHDITIRYNDLLVKIMADQNAQKVYEKLVQVGKDISDAKETGKELGDEFIEQNESLKNDLNNMPIVREFVEAQKDYFEMISSVQKLLTKL